MSQPRRIDVFRPRRRWAAALAVLSVTLATAAGSATAASLGELRVQSHQGEPLRAEIELGPVAGAEGSPPLDPGQITIALAPPEAYAGAGLAYPAALAQARWQVEQRADGRYVARVQTDAPMEDTFVDLLVELRWPGGSASRTYTVLVEPQRPAQAAEPAQAPMIVRPEAAAPADGEATPDRSPRPGDKAPAAVYKVRRGDHLYGIAADLLPARDAVSLDQMVVALFRANPRAFINGNMNRLKAGAVLKLPTEPEAGDIPRREARNEVVAHTRAFDAYRRRLAEAAAATDTPPGDGQQQAGRISARVRDEQVQDLGPRDQLTLTKPEAAVGQPPDAAAEAEIARQRQLREAEDRLAQLRKNVDEIGKLIELKNAELAQRTAEAQGPADGLGQGPAVAASMPAAAANAPAASGAPWAGPYALPAAGALIALLAGYGLYRRQRRAEQAPVTGPLAFEGLTLPLDAFPSADLPPRAADRPGDAGGASAEAEPGLEEDNDAANGMPAGPAAAQPRAPAFDFSSISLDLGTPGPSTGTPGKAADAEDGQGNGVANGESTRRP